MSTDILDPLDSINEDDLASAEAYVTAIHDVTWTIWEARMQLVRSALEASASPDIINEQVIAYGQTHGSVMTAVSTLTTNGVCRFIDGLDVITAAQQEAIAVSTGHLDECARLMEQASQ